MNAGVGAVDYIVPFLSFTGVDTLQDLFSGFSLSSWLDMYKELKISALTLASLKKVNHMM